MAHEDSWEPVVQSLVSMTKSKRLRWSRATSALRTPLGEKRGIVYIAEYLGKTIAAYQYEYRHFSDVDEYTWSSDVAIEFVDDSMNSTWRFPETEARWELMDAIRYVDSGAENFLKKFLETDLDLD